MRRVERVAAAIDSERGPTEFRLSQSLLSVGERDGGLELLTSTRHTLRRLPNHLHQNLPTPLHRPRIHLIPLLPSDPRDRLPRPKRFTQRRPLGFLAVVARDWSGGGGEGGEYAEGFGAEGEEVVRGGGVDEEGVGGGVVEGGEISNGVRDR